MSYCTNCGAPDDGMVNFCGNCGQKLDDDKTEVINVTDSQPAPVANNAPNANTANAANAANPINPVNPVNTTNPANAANAANNAYPAKTVGGGQKPVFDRQTKIAIGVGAVAVFGIALVLIISAFQNNPQSGDGQSAAAPTLAPQTSLELDYVTPAPNAFGANSSTPTPTMLPTPTPEPGLVYDATADFQGFADWNNLPGCDWPGHEGLIHADGSGRLTRSGLPSISPSDGGTGVDIKNRADNWDALDITLGGLADGKYRIVITASADRTIEFWAELQAAAIEDCYGEILGTRASGAKVTIECYVSIANGRDGMNNRLRINATQGVNYTVESIKIYAE